MKNILTTLLLGAVASATATSQETYWIANRASSDIMQVSPWGSVLNRIAMPTTLRSAHVAPDGKVWVIRFIQATFDIVDPTTGTITPITGTGSAYSVAFDAQGTAWMTAGSTVHNYDASGTLIQSYPLTVGSALGITIDTLGNKWIAHRVAPASVSRIDPTGAITNFPLTGASAALLPVSVAADFRGLLNPSHIWVIGDSAANIVELDSTGTVLNVYTPPVTPISNLAVAPNGRIWVGNTAGSLLEIDETNGAVLNTYSQPPSVLGIAFDPAGSLWITERITFSGVGPPCEVRRLNPTTGIVEVPGVLQFGGYSSTGTQSALSTPYMYSLVAAPFTDLDGDGEVNYSEVQGGTSPTDPLSNFQFHMETAGITSIGNTPTLDIRTGASTFWLMAISYGLVAPGSGYSDPAFVGEFRLDPALTLGTTFSGLGSSNYSIAIPNDPSFRGIQFFFQGFHLGPPALSFTNIAGLLIW